MKIKQFYKTLSIALALVLCIGIFGACSDDKIIGGGGGGGNEYLHITDGEDTNIQSGVNYALPAKMTFTAPTPLSQTASSGVTVTATIEPSYATNKEVDWEVSFVDDTHAWAVGKTASSYVTATPTVSGSTTAVIECIAAFGAEIKITVTSRLNPEATASCAVNYVQRFNGINKFYFESATQTYADGTAVPDIVFDSPNATMDWINFYNIKWKRAVGTTATGSAYGQPFVFESNSGYGVPGQALIDTNMTSVYTIANSVEHEIEVEVNQGFRNAFAPALRQYMVKNTYALEGLDFLTFLADSFKIIFYADGKLGMHTALFEAVNVYDGPDINMKITSTPTHGETVVTEYSITFNRNSFAIAPQSITLDGDIIF